MSDGCSDAAAVEVNHASTLTAGEDDAPVEGIVALPVEQTEMLQEIGRIALSGEIPAQASTGGVADAHFFDQHGIMQSALLQIAPRLGVAIALLLIKSGGFLEHSGRIGCSSTVLLEVSEALAEGQLPEQLNKAQEIATLATTVAVEEIFVDVYVEGGAGLWV